MHYAWGTENLYYFWSLLCCIGIVILMSGLLYLQVKVVSAKVDFSKVHSKVGSKDKIDHKPKGGDKKVRFS